MEAAAKKATVIPPWAERLVVAAIENYVSPEFIRETVEGWKDALIAKLREAAKKTATGLDDAAVDLLDEVLGTCSPDKQFICQMILNAEVAAVAFLEAAVTATPTKIDDALVAVVKKALLGA